jgi:hypothetical protein
MLIYIDNVTLHIVSEEKLARCVPNVAFSMWSVWHEGRERAATPASFSHITQMMVL